MAAATRKRKVFGVIAEFGSAAELYQAAEQVRDRGYCFWDVHSPFPIHGMDEAMGLKKSPLPLLFHDPDRLFFLDHRSSFN
jgi:hypothetical protein